MFIGAENAYEIEVSKVPEFVEFVADSLDVDVAYFYRFCVWCTIHDLAVVMMLCLLLLMLLFRIGAEEPEGGRVVFGGLAEVAVPVLVEIELLEVVLAWVVEVFLLSCGLV